MSQQQMKALQLTKDVGASTPTLSLTDVQMRAIQPGEVLIKVHASGIQPSDRLNVKGGFPSTSFPRIPGRDFAGVIVDGPKERIGEEVFGTGAKLLSFSADGAQAEYLIAPEALAAKKAETMSFAQAAVVGVPFSTAMLCLRRARVQSKDTVLVLGATGQVGSATAQIAKAMGCKVLTASRKDVTDVNTSSDPKLESIQSLTGNNGVDVVVDTVGGLDLMEAAIDQLAMGGRYAYISAPRGGASTLISFDIFKGYRKSVELIGCNTGIQEVESTGEDLKTLSRMFEEGKIVPKPESDYQKVPLDDAVKEYENPSGKPAVVAML